MQLANNENVQLHHGERPDLVDPAFASEVLTIGNSMLYAPRFPAQQHPAGDRRAGRQQSARPLPHGGGAGVHGQSAA